MVWGRLPLTSILPPTRTITDKGTEEWASKMLTFLDDYMRKTALKVNEIVTDLEAGAVLCSDYDAHTILYATTDDTPVALTIAASRVVGRKATGNICAMTGAETRTVLGIDTDDSVTFGTVTATSFTIGEATLNETIFGYLCIQDQPVATISTPTFSGLTTNLVNLDFSSNDWRLTSRDTGSYATLAFQNQNDDLVSLIEIYSKKGDRGDVTGINIFGYGTPSTAGTNNERLSMSWGGSAYAIASLAGGNGVVKDIYIYTGANTSQFIASSDGNIAMSGDLAVTGDVTGANLNVSNWDDAYTHVSNDGTDHTYIDQDLQQSASPTFVGLTLSGDLSVTGAYYVNTYLYHLNDTDTGIVFGSDNFYFQAGGKQFIKMYEGAGDAKDPHYIAINDDSNDIDFRVEGDGNANLFKCDAGNDNVSINGVSVSAHYDLGLFGDGVLCLKETSTPTADANYGKLYCKNDDKLYFQDGAGTEHEVEGSGVYNFYDRGDPSANDWEQGKCSATADDTGANHLLDADGDFVNNGVNVGDWAHNTTDDTWAQITNVAAGDLTLDDDIFESGEDYEIGSFCTDGPSGDYSAEYWHDLDCSSIVPAGTQAIVFQVNIESATTEAYFLMRKNGNSNIYSFGWTGTQVANVYTGGQFTIPCDSNRVVECWARDVTWTAINVTIVGYFK